MASSSRRRSSTNSTTLELNHIEKSERAGAACDGVARLPFGDSGRHEPMTGRKVWFGTRAQDDVRIHLCGRDAMERDAENLDQWCASRSRAPEGELCTRRYFPNDWDLLRITSRTIAPLCTRMIASTLRLTYWPISASQAVVSSWRAVTGTSSGRGAFRFNSAATALRSSAESPDQYACSRAQRLAPWATTWRSSADIAANEAETSAAILSRAAA